MPALGPVKFLTVHCAATPEGRHVSHEQITAWDKAKFGQTSYHWVVELDGSMHRTLKDDQKGAHTGGANTGNIRTYKERYHGIIIRGHRDWPGVNKARPPFSVADWLQEAGD